ncbi:hypothetical protein ABK249_22920 [Neorhizobium sp. Rsf11]|uniref:Uncharacterized protein n=1 Tax=Neorhizobium phenanthreniclasticum TaxID=3157917 RepID=A0ABV0M7F8_9HYPH
MKECLFAVTLLTAVPAMADPINVPPEMTESLEKAAMRLAFADGCDKRLDRPELFADAKEAFARFLAKANVADPNGRAEEIAKLIREKPQEKETGPFSLFNEKMCGDLAGSLKDELR